MSDASEPKGPTAVDLWGRFGVTQHPGGVCATRRLVSLCDIRPGQSVLVVGCGTGHTACLLAKEYGARVFALDIGPQVLQWAAKRVVREGVGDKVTLLVADAHRLPFAVSTFDAVIAESVLIFCDQLRVASEARRVLKPGGVFGDNELTYLKPPPDALRALLSREIFGLRVRPLLEDRWRAVFQDAGFGQISSSVHRLSLREQFLSHLEVDGVSRFLSSTLVSVLDPAVRAAYFNFDVIKATLRFLPYVGYGQYVCKNPSDP